MVFHSALNQETCKQACGCALPPIKTTIRGPAAPWTKSPDEEDILDETLGSFKANVLFRNFEIKGPADRTLCYFTLFIQQCLEQIVVKRLPTKTDALKALTVLSLENFSIPGDSNFALGGLVSAPKTRDEAEAWRGWTKQAREELMRRLLELVYLQGKPSKWWTCFARKKFMNKTL